MRRRKRRAFQQTGLVLATVALAATVSVSRADAAQYHINYGTASGAAVPLTTSYTATSSAVSLVTTASPYGNLITCSASTLGGVTDAIVSGGPSAGLTVTSGSFSKCYIVAGGLHAVVTIYGNFSPAWQITPTGGTSSPFTGTATHVSFTLECSPNSETYTGTLSTGGVEINASSGSYVTMTHAASLTATARTGNGCAAPSTVDVSGTYTLATVAGQPIMPSGANNFWLSYS